jgi:hypothetical protein
MWFSPGAMDRARHSEVHTTLPPQKKISVQRKGTSQRVPVRAEGDAHAAHTTLAITAAPSIG